MKFAKMIILTLLPIGMALVVETVVLMVLVMMVQSVLMLDVSIFSSLQCKQALRIWILRSVTGMFRGS